MRHIHSWLFMAAIVGGVGTASSAQSFNLDIGQPGAGPPDTYGGAANQPGHWMSLPCTQGVTVFNLTDIHGNVTNARLSQIGGTQTLLVNDPAITGDDATLMNDFLITFTSVENCLFFRDMEAGEYEVIVYARMPDQPNVMGYTSCDQEPGIPHTLVGGVWPGHHQELISYSRHTAFVTDRGPDAGKLFMHSGVAPGGNYQIGAALNGVQIRKIIPAVPGDITGNGVVNADDLLAVINAWGACPQPCPPSCAADVTGDCEVNANDLLVVINNWS